MHGGEIFYVQGDQLMSVPVYTEPELAFGEPTELFSAPTSITYWEDRWDSIWHAAIAEPNAGLFDMAAEEQVAVRYRLVETF